MLRPLDEEVSKQLGGCVPIYRVGGKCGVAPSRRSMARPGLSASQSSGRGLRDLARTLGHRTLDDDHYASRATTTKAGNHAREFGQGPKAAAMGHAADLQPGGRGFAPRRGLQPVPIS